ncbi:MAG TPA: GlsB/YeaQ/YmgE family stress response membrane protein [Rubrobacteraceae bacterium]|jgi:uncharacterized membrane protein YeaQ/YmgE (transglycosylase-associated protein family)|nr:GlsB/YeaQ/YmgE family stress response membrane protein [Rubrobacteraceae bacterium]
MIGALIWWIIVGLIAGALAKLIMPGDDPGGIIVTIVIGIVGAVIGGFILTALGIGTAGTGFIWTIIAGIIGALILLAIYRAVIGGRGRRV